MDYFILVWLALVLATLPLAMALTACFLTLRRIRMSLGSMSVNLARIAMVMSRAEAGVVTQPRRVA